MQYFLFYMSQIHIACRKYVEQIKYKFSMEVHVDELFELHTKKIPISDNI